MVRGIREIRWIQEIIKILQQAVYYLCIIGAVVMLFMMFLTVADIIGRSFFAWPITGAYELSRFFLAVMVLFG
jgi:TRAP-type C4-dicarboxylate transport system permease small subunit